MKKTINLLVHFGAKINKTHLQLAFMILALAMLVIGAGAPEDVGGIVR